jgi:hypothetical protein
MTTLLMSCPAGPPVGKIGDLWLLDRHRASGRATLTAINAFDPGVAA